MSLVPSSPIPGTSTPEIIPGIWGFSHHFLLFSVPLNATIIYQTDTSQQALLTEGAEAKVLAAHESWDTENVTPMPWDEGPHLCGWPRFSPGGCGSQGMLCELPLPTSIAVVSQAKGVRRTRLRNCESPWRRAPAWGDVVPQTPPTLCKGPLTHCRQVPQLSSWTLSLTENKSNVSSNQSICPVPFVGLRSGYDFPRKQFVFKS